MGYLAIILVDQSLSRETILSVGSTINYVIYGAVLVIAIAITSEVSVQYKHKCKRRYQKKTIESKLVKDLLAKS